MAVFATGNPGWDQGLNSLAGSLFPDPSKQAQAGYYGAETAKTLLEANRLRDEKGYRDSLANRYGISLTTPTPVAAPIAPAAPSPLANTVAPLPTAPGGGVPPPVPGPGPAPGPMPPPVPGPAPGPVPGPAPAATPAATPPAAGGVATMSIPQLLALSFLGGTHAPEASLLARAELNQRVRAGQVANDPAVINRELSGLGDSAPLQAANTLANTRLQGQNAVTLADNEIMSVVPKGQTTPVSRTKGYIKAHPEEFEAYDSARAIAGDTPKIVSSVPGSTTGTPVIEQTRNSYGKTPYDETQAAADNKIVTVVLRNGARVSMLYGKYRQDPSVGRLENERDQGTTTIIGARGLPEIMSTPEAVAAGAQPAPTGTDQVAATGAAGVTSTTLNNPPAAPALAEAVRAGQENIQPRTPLTPDQELRISGMIDQAVQHMYPVPGGFHWSNTSALAALSAGKKAEVVSRVRDLALTAKYRSDPAAAVPAVLQQMQAEGKLPKAVDRGLGWFSQTAPYLTGGKDPRFIVDEAPALADTVTKSMPGGQAAPAQTAPAQTAPAVSAPAVSAPAGPPPPGALSPAPAGAPNGKILYAPNGSPGRVQDGWVFPLTAAPTAAPAQPAPTAPASAPKPSASRREAPNVTGALADLLTAPARAVARHQAPRAPETPLPETLAEAKARALKWLNTGRAGTRPVRSRDERFQQ